MFKGLTRLTSILLGVTIIILATQYASVSRWKLPEEKEVPAVIGGMPVANWSLTQSTTLIYDGLVKQEDDPYHDWEADPSGPKVLSLDLLDPQTGYVDTFILTTQNGGLFRFFHDENRQHEIWSYRGSKPVKISGKLGHGTDVKGETFKQLSIEAVAYSDLGEWYDGTLSRMNADLGSYYFYKYGRLCDIQESMLLSLRIEIGNDLIEVPLASHEGWIYIIPFCGTSQPIADYRFNQSVKIYGLMMPVENQRGIQQALMVFDVRPR